MGEVGGTIAGGGREGTIREGGRVNGEQGLGWWMIGVKSLQLPACLH